jgi:hypothetical protein
MFTPWIKRTSLKRAPRSKRLVVDGQRPSMILLLSFSVLLVMVGVVVVSQSRASDVKGSYEAPMPAVSASVSPSPSMSPSNLPTTP